MALQGEYEPSPVEWVRNQVETYERSGGTEGTTLLDTGQPVIVLWTHGTKSGNVRKSPLMRVEHQGEYALIASLGGAPRHPQWYLNLAADPAAAIQDGPELFDVHVREAVDAERLAWWERAVAAFPNYADYQRKTTRIIPVMVATRQ